MSTRDLDGVVIAFDLDNTLIEFDPRDYECIVREFLSRGEPLGLVPAAARPAYEVVRTWGNAMERLGLANPSHRRGHAHALAVLGLLFGALPHHSTRDALPVHKREHLRHDLDDLDQRERATRHGFPSDRLIAEIELRRLLDGNRRLAEFAEIVCDAATEPALAAWAAAYGQIERAYQVHDFAALFDEFAARGAVAVVITHGLIETQMAKISRLGLESRLIERVLITESAADLPGRRLFDEALDARLDECAASGRRPDAALDELWLVRCVLHDWGRKSPAFFARCLHALHGDGHRPAEALRRVAFIDRVQWSARPLRFVMIGDRHDLDIAPVRELLGHGSALTVLLTQGKYGRAAQGEAADDKVPADHVFPEWDRLEYFLRQELRSARLRPIAVSPNCFSGMAMSTERLAGGLDSPLETVRVVAGLADRVRRSG